MGPGPVIARGTIPAPPRKRRAPTPTAVLLIAAFGAFLAFLDSTIVNVAFPNIRASFPGASTSSLSWVLNAYNIVFGAFLVAAGRIADLLGRRRMFLFGVLLFTISSVACATVSSPLELILFRVVQGLGAALLVPASLALVIEAFPEEHITHAVTLWGAAAALAAGLGPPIGGALVTSANWRLAFLVNLPIGIAAYFVGRRGLVESRAPGRRRMPDLRGALLLAAGLSILTLAIVKGSNWGWESGLVVGSFCLAAVLLTGFAFSNRRHASPILDPILLRQRRFAVANVLTLTAGAGFYVYTLNHILWLNYIWHYSLWEAGLAVAPGAVVAAIVARPFGTLAEQRGHPTVVAIGAVIWAVALGFFYAHRVGIEPDFLGQWLPAQVVSGIGVGATLPLLASAAVAGVPGRRYATASAAVSGSRQLGAVIGIAILVVILGTHRGPALVEALRHGWEFAAACFAVVAVCALLLGRDSDLTLVAESAEESRIERGHRADSQLRLSNPDGERHEELEHVPIFADLSEEAISVLDEVLVPVEVAAGDWLILAGERGDAMYVIERGQLEVHVGERAVARLGRGDVVGELALLTGTARSASIRARRDTRLRRLDADRFDEVARRHPGIPLAVAQTLARRLQRAEAPAVKDAPARVVAVVAADDTLSVNKVSATLLSHLAVRVRAVDPGRVGADELERLEEQFDRVFLTAAHDDPAWRDFCVRAADRVVLVSGPRPPARDQSAALPKDVDLVVAGPLAPSTIAAWYSALDPTSMHVIGPGGLADGMRPLADRLLGHSIGLVLSGGGARALCHVGVIDALEDAKVPIDRIAGTSTGAIIGALYAAGYDASELDAVVYEEFVRKNPHSDYTVPRHGLTRGQKTRAALIRRFGDARIEELPREFRCVSVDLLRRETIVHHRGSVVDAVMASLRLPGLYSPYRINDVLHVDGGVMDNVPVDALAGPPEGPIVAVAVDLGDAASRNGEMPNIRETLIRSILISSHQAAERSLAKADVVIRPRADSVGLLEWHQFDIVRQAGRHAAQNALWKIEGLRSGVRV